ncbi:MULTISPECIES: hypothetical protein [Delftia]|uniref:hypothetical protein n=1 Tax=Delftia TaxID=80865 RepID=UPI00233E7051|nr:MULTISPECIES: hypothetical protein [Delftia]MDC2858652.1 hypothetical protein [Delftia sp. DT-2]
MKDKFLAALIAPAIVVAVLGYVFFMSYKSGGEPAKKPPEIDARRNALYACEESIRKKLHDPGSAQFPPRGEFIVTPVSEPVSYDVIVDVRAKNAFNALRLNRFKCEIRELSTGTNGGISWRSSVQAM